jgi:hypothetical protein
LIVDSEVTTHQKDPKEKPLGEPERFVIESIGVLAFGEKFCSCHTCTLEAELKTPIRSCRIPTEVRKQLLPIPGRHLVLDQKNQLRKTEAEQATQRGEWCPFEHFDVVELGERLRDMFSKIIHTFTYIARDLHHYPKGPLSEIEKEVRLCVRSSGALVRHIYRLQDTEFLSSRHIAVAKRAKLLCL